MNFTRELNISYFEFTVMFGSKTLKGPYTIIAYMRHTPIKFSSSIINNPVPSMSVAQLAATISAVHPDKISLRFKGYDRNTIELYVEYDSLCGKPVFYKIDLVNYENNTDEWMEAHGFDKIKKQYTDLKDKYDDLIANIHFTQTAMERYMSNHMHT